MKDESVCVRKTDKRCVFIIGQDSIGYRKCLRSATLVINGSPLCDRHAAYAMTAACGRDTTIKREDHEKS